MSLFMFLMIAAFVLGALDGLRSDRREEADPLDLARPSIERMEAEALEAAKELRQLEPPGRE
jgi:hypothetical protein